MHKLKRGEVTLVSTIPNCYFCEQDGETKPGPYDFATIMGPWANGCEAHWKQYRAASTLGTGKGQLWVTEDQVDRSGPAEPDPHADIRAELATLGLAEDEMEDLMDDFGMAF